MDFGWIDDLIAIERTGSLSKAAELRNVTQPAFSRRIASIEHWLGASIVNRSNRPLKLSAEISDKMHTLHDVAATLRHFKSELQASQGSTSKVVIAAQHSLTASTLPAMLMEKIHERQLMIKLMTAYPEDAVTLLLNRQVDILVAYETSHRSLFGQVPELERSLIMNERFVPVTSSQETRDRLVNATTEELTKLQVITFPRHTLFGRTLWEDIAGALPDHIQLVPFVESAISTSIVQFVLAGTGVAWLPSEIVAPYLKTGQVLLLDDLLPYEELHAYCFRFKREIPSGAPFVWSVLTDRS